MSVRLENDQSSRACVVRLDGELDLAVVPELRANLAEVIETGCQHVVLDLEHVSYMDSTALGLVVWLDHQLAETEGRLVLAGANTDVSRILELTGLIGVAPTIRVRESVEESLAGLQPSESAESLRWSESILLPARAESLAEVRTFVCDLLATAEVSEAALFDVKVAVGEALANAVRHGSPGGDTDQVRIDVSAFEDRVVIQVRDRGVGFDESREEGRAGDDLFASGGRGVLFMRALMDRVDFSKDAKTGGTVVTLEKRLPVRRT